MYKELDFNLGGSPNKEFIQRIARFNIPLSQEIKNRGGERFTRPLPSCIYPTAREDTTEHS
jgi:hypothetical protein